MNLNEMKIEDLEMLSYNDIAKLYLEETKTPLSTADLFKKICNLLKLSEKDYQEKIADFFQTLTTSKDFILLSDGKWDLKSRHSVKIVMDDLYEEKDEEETDNSEFESEPEDITLEDEFNTIDDEEEYAEEDLDDLTILSEEDLDSE